MGKKILNIVVTGGPCGGKTTSLDELSKLLRSYGYTVFICPEAATELINNGIRPFGDYSFDLKAFQSIILDMQVAHENIRRKAARLCSNDKVAILYDRGILDNRAYINDEIFSELMIERGMNEVDILTSYDIVIHLVTSAIGKEEYYTTLNNEARTETVEQARIQDKKTMETWRKQKKKKIVGNDTLFDEKILKVKNVIRAYLGEEEITRQERYLVLMKDIDFNMMPSNIIKENIEEFVINYDNEEIEMYFQSTINSSSYYTCMKKRKDSNTRTYRTISKEEYNDYQNRVKGQIMKKIRYNFIDEGERFRLDLFKSDDTSYAILERDVTNPRRNYLPLFIKNGKDVTNNRDYDDDSLYVDYNINYIYKKNTVK